MVEITCAALFASIIYDERQECKKHKDRFSSKRSKESSDYIFYLSPTRILISNAVLSRKLWALISAWKIAPFGLLDCSWVSGGRERSLAYFFNILATSFCGSPAQCWGWWSMRKSDSVTWWIVEKSLIWRVFKFAWLRGHSNRWQNGWLLNHQPGAPVDRGLTSLLFTRPQRTRKSSCRLSLSQRMPHGMPWPARKLSRIPQNEHLWTTRSILMHPSLELTPWRSKFYNQSHQSSMVGTRLELNQTRMVSKMLVGK